MYRVTVLIPHQSVVALVATYSPSETRDNQSQTTPEKGRHYRSGTAAGCKEF